MEGREGHYSMLEDIKASLAECGFSKKETAVYLAMLELGPSSVQDIGKKAGVNRTTTYLLVESLKRRGVSSSFHQGKKTVFAAESPERLLSGVVNEIAGVRAKQERLKKSLPRLLAIFHAAGDQPKVRFFEGEEALGMIRKEIGECRESIWEAYAVDEPLIRVANIKGKERIQATKRTRGRVLMAIKPGLVPPYFDIRGTDVRLMDYGRLPFSGDIAITSDKLYIVTTAASGMGIVVESKEIVAMIRALYEAAWQCGKEWKPPAGWGNEERE